MTAIPYNNRISIRDFLAQQGILPKYERNGYGMYLSPLREERTPSFKVDYVRNLWYDFGSGEGGTLLTLVMRLERCDSREAIRRLQNGEKRNVENDSLSLGIGQRPVAGGFSPVVRPTAVPALRILSDASLRQPALVGYLSSRGIVPSVAAAFCREVRYEVNGRAFFAVDFRNDAGRKTTSDLIRLCPPPQRDNRPKAFLQRAQGCNRLSDRPYKIPAKSLENDIRPTGSLLSE